MYRFQGTTRSNGIYCEPDATSHHHFSPPHMSKKMSKMRNQTHRSSRSHNRSQHLPPHRNDASMDSEVDSSSEVSDGTYPDSDSHGMNLTNRLNITQNGGVDSPPEPAPADLPMRMNGALRSLKPNYGDIEGDSELSGYHIQPGTGAYLQQDYLIKVKRRLFVSSYTPKPFPHTQLYLYMPLYGFHMELNYGEKKRCI
ncbi:unnamed protein product [Allacma fusca]|uniref:Uncharacterized protein n=1 Tax=Allacma fusca TaxID=39272 RepID=A0A8J2NQY1_9HEXA|nr:unnamed protein product [Allacma fusca]